MPRLFALDQNFPAPIVEVLEEYQAVAELVSVRDVHPDFATLDDWQILLSLHLDERPWDGLITTDTGMLNQPLELSVLLQTKLTLVAVKDAGGNPVKASGLLFAYLEGICKHTDPTVAQVWTPAAANKPSRKPWEALQRVAEHQGTTAPALYEAYRLDEDELARHPLEDADPA